MFNRNCVICDKNFTVKYKSNTKKTCSVTCRVSLSQATNLEKYGHINPLHSESGKAVVIASLQKRYGEDVTHFSQIPGNAEKRQKTCIKNFGVPWPMQSQEVRDKSIKTLIREYGVDNISKYQPIIDKIQESLTTPSENLNGLTPREFGQLKIIDHNKTTYGVEYFFQSEEFKEIYKKTMIEKYGVDNFFKSEEFNELMLFQGRRYSSEMRSEIDNYYADVWSYTYKTYMKNKELICSKNIRSHEYHLDHKFSIYEGFKQNIDPKIIGSLCNLEIIPRRDNIIKGKSCSISLDELIKMYNDTEHDS